MLRRTSLFPVVVLTCATFLASTAKADDFRFFHASGTAFFTPVNIGTASGPGDAGFVIGDGSGVTPYPHAIGFGNLVGHHTHSGSIQTFGTGFLSGDGTKIRWPGKQGPNDEFFGLPIHVLTAADGSQIFLEFKGIFTLDLVTGRVRGDALFKPIGGTGRFKNVRGRIYCLAITEPVDLSQPLPDSVDFDWDWIGFLSIGDDD